MVKSIIVVCFLLVLAVPALAQDDFPRIEVGVGYGNITFPSLTVANQTDRHSGFVSTQSLNLARTWGVENFMGVYSIGQGAQMIAEMVGLKAMYRGAHVVPYVAAGLGVGYFTASSSAGYTASASSFGVRYGGGVEVPMGGAFGLKFDVSRIGTGNPFFGNRTTNTNFMTGVVFRVN